MESRVISVAVQGRARCLSNSPNVGSLNGDEEIPRFDLKHRPHRSWGATEFDARSRLGTAKALASLYLKPGTPGLHDWTRLRLEDAATMAKTVDSAARYYESARASTLRIAEAEPRIRAVFRKLKEIYPDAAFPGVYFLIGRLNSGGTTSGAGLLIGAEMYGRTDDPVVDRMGDWLSAVLRPVEDVPGVVAHELVHFEQGRPGRSLLARSLNEGSADFIGEMISGLNINAHVHAWVHAEDGRERALGGVPPEDARKGRRRLVHNGRRKEAAEGPRLLMGYRIAQTHYERATDKKAAIRDILHMSDPKEFLERSGYAERWR